MADQIFVLLVEDNRADAELVIEGLKEFSPDIEVKLAGGGQEAVAFLRKHLEPGAEPPMLIIMDLNIPRGSGFETLQELKADEQLRRVPVVILTTSRSQREINRAYDLGAAAVLNKPMRLEEHRDMMRSLNSFWLRHVRLPLGTR